MCDLDAISRHIGHTSNMHDDTLLEHPIYHQPKKGNDPNSSHGNQSFEQLLSVVRTKVEEEDSMQTTSIKCEILLCGAQDAPSVIQPLPATMPRNT